MKFEWITGLVSDAMNVMYYRKYLYRYLLTANRLIRPLLFIYSKYNKLGLESNYRKYRNHWSENTHEGLPTSIES